ncbi:hypothetical protein B0H11DRAFT_2127452 [Mycena galericulata]|nr:hypothetical protein B0H11DRAFT_2127452 [Mycena galericulata]
MLSMCRDHTAFPTHLSKYFLPQHPTQDPAAEHPPPFEPMSFISNCDRISLGDGVYNNVHGNIVYNSVYERKRYRPGRTKRRRQDEDELEVIRIKRLKLTHEIGSGPGYLIHAGENKGRAIIVKVFNAGPTSRKQLELTVALSKELVHPNVLRIEGISAPTSPIHFIAYENVWKNAEGPLAAALKDDLSRSISLGLKMIAGISAGMNYLTVQGISLAALSVENFDIFLDVKEKFLISINAPSAESDFPDFNMTEDEQAWSLFNLLCCKVLRSANRTRHNDELDRFPAPLDELLPISPSEAENTGGSIDTGESLARVSSRIDDRPVPPRRDYVWRDQERGQQSLATVSRRIASDLEVNLSSSGLINRLAVDDSHKLHHECTDYIREEITLTTRASDSAVVSRNRPSLDEICQICHQGVSTVWPSLDLENLDTGSPGLFGPRSPRESRNGYLSPSAESWGTWKPDLGFVPTPPSYEFRLLIPDSSSPGLFGPRSPRESRYRGSSPTTRQDVLSKQGFVPTPPSHEPRLLISDSSSPGLFGPRSPRESRYRGSSPTTRQDVLSKQGFVPTPPSHEPRLLIPDSSSPGLFGPRSPRESRYRGSSPTTRQNVLSEQDNVGAGLFSDQVDVSFPVTSPQLEPLTEFDFLGMSSEMGNSSDAV